MGNNFQVRKAVILASGYGRRMRQKGRFPSKPMRVIGHKPLISYVIDLLIYGGIEKIYIVYHSVTSDVLDLLTYSDAYAEYLEFIEEDEKKGTLLSFSRVKQIWLFKLCVPHRLFLNKRFLLIGSNVII